MDFESRFVGSNFVGIFFRDIHTSYDLVQVHSDEPRINRNLEQSSIREQFVGSQFEIITTTMSEIRIQPVEDEQIQDVDRIRRTFLNSKHFCCCIPVGIGPFWDIAKDYQKHPELKKVCGVAISPQMGVVGICQLLFEGMPDSFHTCKPGEAHVLVLAVNEEARGMGVGSKLLAWAEKVARERQCTYMSLEVVNGNPATGLYERKGYVIQKEALWKKVFLTIPYLCCMSPMIFGEGSSSYCHYGQIHFMTKPLE